MKQDVGENSGTAEQPQKAGTAPKPAPPAINLYEPYITPPFLYHALRFFVIAAFTLVARVRIRGRDNIPKNGAFILASNHLSWTDIPLIPCHLPRRVVYMAKEEYFVSKIKWFVRFLGAFPVKRGEGDRQALRAAEAQLKKGNILGIFPEGTRSRTQTMAKAHPGMGMIALRSGVPVVPVAVWGSENVLKKPFARATVSYGTPIVLKPKGAKITRGDIDAATQEVMTRIAAMLPPEYRGVYADLTEKQP